MRAVKHNRGEACVDASLCALKSTVIEVESNGNCDIEFLKHTFNHAHNGLVAAHILACALGNAENNGRFKFFGGKKNSLCPFQIVDVELTYGVLAVAGFVQHILCGNES